MGAHHIAAAGAGWCRDAVDLGADQRKLARWSCHQFGVVFVVVAHSESLQRTRWKLGQKKRRPKRQQRFQKPQWVEKKKKKERCWVPLVEPENRRSVG